jgi:hypothetical protein
MGQDEYHLVVHVWIKNRNGEYLFRLKRQHHDFPDFVDTTERYPISTIAHKSLGYEEVDTPLNFKKSLVV